VRRKVAKSQIARSPVRRYNTPGRRPAGAVDSLAILKTNRGPEAPKSDWLVAGCPFNEHSNGVVMLGRTLQIFLIAAILACPFKCRLGMCCCVKQAETPACCEKCRSRHGESDTPQRGSDETPSSPGHGPCDKCQCLCGGAVLDNSQRDALLRVASTFESLPGEQFPAESFTVDWQLLTKFLSDEGRTVSGRAICCLHMSFLC
jgi:hypothetical protein